jgi:hypothetical protein
MLAALSTAAFAQAGVPDWRTQTPEGAKPPAESTVPPTDPSTNGAKPDESLGERLRQGEGVLEPPRGIDPEIRKPPPDEFKATTPVIPPPGEPGGDPEIQPK